MMTALMARLGWRYLYQWVPFLPGIVVCIAGAMLSWLLSSFLPAISSLLIAIILGAVWRNSRPIPDSLSAGVSLCSRTLLRGGIVLLGLQLSLSSISQLGPGILLVVLISVGCTFATTLWAGKLLGISLAQRLLIASGFAICGAAAVAATESATRARKEEVATAIGLVVLFGTLMIPTVPLLGRLLQMTDESIGVWIGASTHEVAHVVAAGETVGGAALSIAVTVKLARVLTLAPIVAAITLYNRRSHRTSGIALPPVVPLFIIGFMAAVLLRTSNLLPAELLDGARLLQTLLLTAAMFALGLGVHLQSLVNVGQRPALLGAVATLVILAVSLLSAESIPLH